MLTVIVGTGKQHLYMQDGEEMLVHPARAVVGGKTYEFRDFSGSFADISLHFLSKKLELPDRARAAICYFLAEYQGKQRLEMDCYAFANLLYGLPSHRCLELHRYWNLRRLWFKPQPGQVVFLLSPRELIFRHAALYLGRGLYVSVYGAGGELEIAELKDMLRDFNAQKVFVATPKNYGRHI